MMHSLSRALHEEVQFDTEKVTSVDWVSHPSLRHADTPEKIDVVMVNGDPDPDRSDLPHYGAGEAVCKPLVAAVANAIYDATGVRLRQAPFRDERVLAALKAAGVESQSVGFGSERIGLASGSGRLLLSRPRPSTTGSQLSRRGVII